MSDTAINAVGLSKRYRIGDRKEHYQTLRDTLADLAKAPFRRIVQGGKSKEPGANPTALSPSPSATHIWALKDVSFKVRSGEIVGIIGRNGAGKTTLLKVLSRITYPTEGRGEIMGRVGSLLEVGTGFHPELTGRENIYLSGVILGMRKAEIDRRFDEIISFAELEKFVDTPVKRYSSGMYVRLAFAIAAHLEPEILLVDEVLAVGDAAFQKKCLGKMEDVSKEGRTVLFVSHNMGAVSLLCERAILLEEGRAIMDGDSSEVIGAYLSPATLSGEVVVSQRRQIVSNDFSFHAVRIRKPGAEVTAQVNLDEGCTLEIVYEISHPLRGANIGFILWNSGGYCVFTSTDVDHNPGSIAEQREPGRYTARCHIPGEYLRPGSYYIDIAASIPNVRALDNLPHVLAFEVLDTGSVEVKISQGRQGVIAPVLSWLTERAG